MKKIIAIVLALVLAMSAAVLLASCDKDEPEENTTAIVVTPEDNTEESTSEDATEAASGDVSEALSEDATSEEATSEEATEAEPVKMPESKEDIIELYNTAANRVKTDAKSVNSPYSKITLAGPTTLPSSINGILRLLGGADKFLGDQLAKNSRTTSETYTGQAAIKASFPVEGEAWASKLTAADVKDAKCVEKDGKYEITIITVADGKSSNVTHGQGHAPKAFNVVLPGIVNDNIPSVATGIVGTASMDYPSCKLVVVIDPATGNMESGVYDLYWTINFDKAGVVLPFLTSTSYKVNY